jgi:hypothetical protein
VLAETVAFAPAAAGAAPAATPNSTKPTKPSAAGPADEDPAAGEAATTDVSEAREAFRLASALAKQGQWLDALAAFHRSGGLKAHPITTFNIAYCERALGHYARAYETFAASLVPAASPTDPALPHDLEAQARSYVAEAEQQLARVRITFGRQDMLLRVDGHTLEPLTTNHAVLVVSSGEATPATLPSTFDLWLDPGTHIFVASTPGSPDAVENHAFAPGASAALRFPSASTGSAASLAPTRGGAPSAAAPADAWNPNWAIVAYGVGAAGLVTSGVFLGLTLKDKSTLDSRCPVKVCPVSVPQDDLRAQANLFADGFGVSLAVAGAGAIVGSYLLVTKTPSRSAATRERVGYVQPWVGVGSAGVSGKF